jgi:K319-like protein
MTTARVFPGLVVAGMLVLVAGSFRSAGAQELQPIYPAYDGFIKNPDGTYTISFAYFSHNSAVVTVPPGADNSFSPAPNDRMQPTTFKPGHWRFQCVMVVPSNFDGKLSWNLSYAGTKTGTSQSMLQSNWFLVEGAEELSKIDYATALKGVCLNRPPVVRVLGAIRREKEEVLGVVGTSGAQESLFGSVNDEGLPRGSSLHASWKQISGPGTVKFEDANKARTHVVYPAAGAYVLELSGTDGEFTATRRITVNVK